MHALQVSKAKFEMLALEHELYGLPEKEKADEIRRKINVLNKGDNLSRELSTTSEFLNEFQVFPSLPLLVEDLSKKIFNYM